VIERTGADNFFSSGTLFRERWISVGKRKGWQKMEKLGIILKKPIVSMYIMDAHITERSYILAGPYRI
jgi:hypothetical protein